MDLSKPAEKIEELPALDRPAALLARVGERLPEGRLRDFLAGKWLGHPAHPMLTDLPIGFWTASFVFDLIPGRGARRSADLLIALGLASALPTAAAGLVDFAKLDLTTRRPATAHAASNLTASLFYGWSLLARLRGHRAHARLLAAVAAAAATAGGHLGGHLTYRRASGVGRVP